MSRRGIFSSVKVINHYGNEVLKVYDVVAAVAWRGCEDMPTSQPSLNGIIS